MPTKASKELYFCPETEKSCPSKRTQNGKRINHGGVCGFRLPRSSKSMEAVKVLKKIGSKLRALPLMHRRKQRCSCKVSSSAALARSRSCASAVDPFDSHRAEAIEDCIEFLNSSASLQRSNSVSSCP